ncbi:hypothetical protein J7T55_013802 [Diaporthe amygdali]|uniref:uncharacterized protein n=1 Tax=Phomopsis amygdali TaxID=1214568 RepID=UPI0022FE63CB|nr:uncharacterized protein J7T55_013802 [Diaporthe amygdali]KAJ0119599.1 hypothetical protein J7T55_013802 [Diaporthe amygdali]
MKTTGVNLCLQLLIQTSVASDKSVHARSVRDVSATESVSSMITRMIISTLGTVDRVTGTAEKTGRASI